MISGISECQSLASNGVSDFQGFNGRCQRSVLCGPKKESYFRLFSVGFFLVIEDVENFLELT